MNAALEQIMRRGESLESEKVQLKERLDWLDQDTKKTLKRLKVIEEEEEVIGHHTLQSLIYR